jgi:hypothetical protein
MALGSPNRIVTFTGPPARAALKVIPLPSGIRTDGISIEASTPPRLSMGGPHTLSAIRTPIAPASCAFPTFTVNAHVPRSMSAI